jgi:hypothetical protein
MKATFQMSDMGHLSFYLGIEVHQDDSGITLRQTAYAKHVVELATDNGASTGCEEDHPLCCGDSRPRPLLPEVPWEAHLVGYSDSDYDGDIDTSKSMSGILFFFGKCLISWQFGQAAGGGLVQLRGRVHSSLHRFDSDALTCSTA